MLCFGLVVVVVLYRNGTQLDRACVAMVTAVHDLIRPAGPRKAPTDTGGRQAKTCAGPFLAAC